MDHNFWGGVYISLINLSAKIENDMLKTFQDICYNLDYRSAVALTFDHKIQRYLFNHEFLLNKYEGFKLTTVKLIMSQ